jgi:hypothetical protein
MNSPQNYRDLSNYLRFNPLPESLRAESSTRIAVDHEVALLQSTTTAQIAAVPFEKKIQRRFAASLGWFRKTFNAAVNDNECGVDE